MCYIAATQQTSTVKMVNRVRELKINKNKINTDNTFNWDHFEIECNLSHIMTEKNCLRYLYRQATDKPPTDVYVRFSSTI